MVQEQTSCPKCILWFKLKNKTKQKKQATEASPGKYSLQFSIQKEKLV